MPSCPPHHSGHQPPSILRRPSESLELGYQHRCNDEYSHSRSRRPETHRSHTDRTRSSRGEFSAPSTMDTYHTSDGGYIEVPRQPTRRDYDRDHSPIRDEYEPPGRSKVMFRAKVEHINRRQDQVIVIPEDNYQPREVYSYPRDRDTSRRLRRIRDESVSVPSYHEPQPRNRYYHEGEESDEEEEEEEEDEYAHLTDEQWYRKQRRKQRREERQNDRRVKVWMRDMVGKV